VKDKKACVVPGDILYEFGLGVLQLIVETLALNAQYIVPDLVPEVREDMAVRLLMAAPSPLRGGKGMANNRRLVSRPFVFPL
jgi:hypothetical protein